MQTAQSLPMSVGVAPGTTTMTLAGPVGETVGCENPARVARQRYWLYPPGKFVAGVQRAGARIRTVMDPYGSIEALRGGLGRVFGRRRRGDLGIVLAPYGDRSPNPSYEMVSATKDFGPGTYCTKRPERGPGFRWWETSAYEPDSAAGGINGTLGAVPTDLQLATQYDHTPVISQWIPFTQGLWSPAPWIPPQGQPATYGPAFMTRRGRGFAGLGDADDVVAPPPLDPISASLLEQRRHQDRMFLLGIISAGAVASTALINVFRYGVEKRTRRRGTAVAAEPAPSISGFRRRRRR
jgi:hypothetical protein